ncbi:MAG: hypothetical protein F4Z15_04330 [Gammaproteobacteria bacterium]|nr:hypothetical protein [Gammaproteobacteria bacterium]MYD76866.1 hypothetical protein [Gammaproteobacteria bacterium]MYJ51815.1 hypothetical protein [Gammaproteobacteria bacterium]
MAAPANRITVVSDTAGMDYARFLAEILGAPVFFESQASRGRIHSRYLLRVSGSRLQLEFPADNRKPIVPKIVPGRTARGADPLLRAIGRKFGTVIDMTGGWCVDASRIAVSGCSTIAFECNPLVYVLCRHAIGRCRIPAIHKRLTLRLGDSAQMMRAEHIDADVVYMDPMYPPRQRDAASPKGIALLREIVDNGGVDLSSGAMLDAAMSRAGRRIVVKRPHHAPAIREGKVGEIRSKQVRYDIYYSGPANGN